MAKPELKLSAPAGGRLTRDIAEEVRNSQAAKPPGGEESLAAAATRDKVAAMHTEQHARSSADNTEQAPDAEDVVPREDIATVELALPDGRQVVFGPPDGVSLTTRIAMMRAGQPPSEPLDMITRCCLCVRSINGKPPPVLSNQVDVAKLANQLGDNALDILAFVLSQYWPAVKLSELQIVKKNLRDS